MSVAYQGWGDVSSGPAMGFKQHMQHQYGGDTAGFKRQQQQEGIVRKLSALSIFMSCQKEPGLTHAYQLHQQPQPQLPLVRDCSADARASCLTVSSSSGVTSPTSSNASHFPLLQSRPGASPLKQNSARDHHSAPVSPSSPMDSCDCDHFRNEKFGVNGACGGGVSPFWATKPVPVPVRPREFPHGVAPYRNGQPQSDLCLPGTAARPLMNDGASQSRFFPRRNYAGDEVEEDLSLSSSDSESDNEDEKDDDCMDAEPCSRLSMFPAGAQSLSCSPPSVLCLRKGLSRHYGGKSRSFTSLADAANCQAQDLAKPDYGRRRCIDKRLGRLERYRMGPLRTWESGISKRGAQGSGKSTLALGMTMITEGKAPATSSFGRPALSQRDLEHLVCKGTEDLRAAVGKALTGSCAPRISLPALLESAPSSLKSEGRSLSFCDLQCAGDADEVAS